MKLQFLRSCLYQILANRLLPDVSFCECLRAKIAQKLLGVKIGRNVHLRANIDFGNDPSRISIGDDSYVNRRCTLYADWGSTIDLGRNVCLGPEVMLWTGTHAIGSPERRCGDDTFQGIAIRDGNWIGSRVTILAGVTIGEGCVVGAASLVNKNIPAHSLAAGVPARVLRPLPE